MKKRILLLIPCILLALGLLTACGGNGSQSSEAVEQQLINATWEGNAKDTSGFLVINLPFTDKDLVTIKFDSDSNGKTGYISVLNQKVDFTWKVTDGKVVLTFGNLIHIPLNYEFSLDGDSLTLKGTGININLKH